MMVVDRMAERLRVTPFSVETAATVFEPRPVALVNTADLSEFLLDDLELLAQKSDFIPQVNSYLMASGLYPGPEAPSSSITVIAL